MSEKADRRYNFKAFEFGNNGDVNVVIETATSDFGYLTQYGFELTPLERQELITILITAEKPGRN